MAPNPVDIDPASVKLLLSIVDLGSISKAARRHGLTQPSASRRIRDLERRVGLQLLERGVAGARLSHDGRTLVEHCRNLVAAGDDLLEAASAIRSNDRSSVSVAVSPESVRFDLPPVCTAALSVPDLQLDVHVTQTIEAAAGVRDGRFDLAIVDGPSAPIGLSDHVLVERPMALIVGAGHSWWDRREEVGIDELLSTSIWLPPRGTGTRDVIEDAVNLTGASTGLRAAGVGDSDLRMAQAVLGRRPAVIRSDWVDDAERVVRGSPRSGSLLKVPTGLRLVQPIRLVWKGRQPGSAAAFAFWHQLRTAAPDFQRP